METPHWSRRQNFGGFEEEEDETAKAFEAISRQLEQMTSPRLSAGTWTTYMDEEDDDGLVKADGSVPTGAVRGASEAYTPSFHPYGRNVMDWWNRELIDPTPVNDDEDDDDEITPASARKLRVTRTSTKSMTPSKRAGTVERASTPVMSNSSQKKSKSEYGSLSSSKASPLLRDTEGTVGDDSIEEEYEEFPVNVQSPWVQQHQDGFSSASPWTGSGYAATTPRAISAFRSQQYEYRRYHDGLLTFLKARRSLSDRIDMHREEQELDSDLMLALPPSTSADPKHENAMLALPPSTSADPKLVSEEKNVEMEFLRTLKSLCWERDPLSQTRQGRNLESRQEGNFWALLHDLRGLGFAALLWSDDPASMRQHALAAGSFFESNATRIHASPKELLDDMKGDDAPLILKRRYQIMKWMEHCLNQLVPEDTRISVSMANSEESSNFSSLEQLGTRNIEKVLQSCLELILAGRLNDACMLLRKVGRPIMAAALGGGAPAGIKKVVHEINRSTELIKVGNVNRALWKEQMRKLSAKLGKNNGENSPTEAAIHSILANDYRTAMENPSLRSWEKGLYVVLHAMWGRSEDELLHLHNNNRRRAHPPFPGTQYQALEKAQLQATCQLSNMTELGAVELLAASPFEEMKGTGYHCRATAALLVGRMALVDFLVEETEALTSPDLAEESGQKVEKLRFVTHMLLYLDSMSACTTPVSVEGIHEYKNKALYAYVLHLASNEDLWHFLILYVSLLPEDVIVGHIPKFLVRVESEEERRMMIQQARDLFPRSGLDLTILRIVVRIMLDEEDDAMSDGDNEKAHSTPTQSDIRKMKAIHWLCFFEEHLGDALIVANMLLRQFLLNSKLASAVMFLHDFLPSEAIEAAMITTVAPNKDGSVHSVSDIKRYHALVGNARSEHVALRSYLKAFRAVEEWDLVMKSTPASQSVVDDKLDGSALNEQEQVVARAMDRRELIREKRKVSEVLVSAAETALNDVDSVLRHEGGWLADIDKDTGFKDESEEGTRRKFEIKTLRSKLLPNAVGLWHTVCADTAAWMWNSLLATRELGSTPKDVLDAIVEGSSFAATDEELCRLSPRYWTKKAKEVAETVASDEHLILGAFGTAELKEMLTSISEIAIAELMYSA